MDFLLGTKQFFKREKGADSEFSKKYDIHNKYYKLYLYVEIIVNTVCELLKFVKQ